MARILIVDDNELNLELAQVTLELAGFDVETADSGAQGVAKARAISPDLILMDLRMPGMSGEEALRVLRADEATCTIPVVVLTASAMKGQEEVLLQQGFDAYMQKPINPSLFAAEVGLILDRASPQKR